MEKAITLVEVMIVVLIVGVLMAIIVPSCVKDRAASQKNECEAYLNQIDTAKEMYAIDNNLSDGASIQWSNIVPKYLKTKEKCSSGGEYKLNPIGTDPTCSIYNHMLNHPKAEIVIFP